MLKRITVIQARMGSTRLPGKVLQKVGDRTILEWVIYRVRQTQLGPLLVTTSTEPADDSIHQLCKWHGVLCFRGSETDVLDRYHRAATAQAALSVIRITADCPLLCPTLLNQTVHMYDQKHVDYCAVRQAPTGLGQEIISAHALKTSFIHANTPNDREHVVTYTIRHPEQFTTAYVPTHPILRDRAHWRLTIDTPQDLRLIRRLYKTTNGRLFKLGQHDLINAVESDPESLELACA